jgi:hypothetical protein
MKTNNIEYLRIGDVVWSVAGGERADSPVYVIKKITSKRVICQEIGAFCSEGIWIHGFNLASGNHSPYNLFRVDKHVPRINQRGTYPYI